MTETLNPAAIANNGGRARRPGRPDGEPTSLRDWLFRAAIAALVLTPVVLMFTLDDRTAIGFAALFLMFILLFLRMPIAFALAIPGLIGAFAMLGIRPVANLLGAEPLAASSNWSLSVLPMFILMGLLLARSGMTSSMYDAARNWFSWLPGGLGIGTNMAGAGLAAVSGSTIGTTYALARVGVPEMFRAGYKKPIVIGSVIVAGLPGQLIPPSIFLIIVAGIMENPVGPQLIAGILPGITVAILFSIMIWVFSLVKPDWAGRGAPGATVTWRDRIVSLVGIWPLIVLMIIVIGGMFMGLLTATEAGAAGAAGALIFTLWFKRKDQPLKHIVHAAVETVSAVGAIFLLLVGAHILTALVVISGIGRLFSDFVVDSGLGRIEFLLLVMVVYIILGMFMDPLAILLTTIPLLLPVLPVLGIDPLWFGVFAVFMGELAILTPPVGILTFVIHKLLQDPAVNLGNRVTVTDVFKAVLLFLPMAILITILWILVPEIVTFLPGLMGT
ncbi:TRAP transporter large permease [Microbacterium lacus]|uniref:TRAP transporter permease n=1 Tax=Microbacterium lacus TaxID=415217 RepID=A0ABN2H0R0_9MICO